jgi:hypothetical protein
MKFNIAMLLFNDLVRMQIVLLAELGNENSFLNHILKQLFRLNASAWSQLRLNVK